MKQYLFAAVLAALVLAQAALYASPVPSCAAFAKTRHDAPVTTTTALVELVELEKRVERTFAVEAAGELRISNQHGRVDYRLHDASEVRIEVLITARAKSERKAQAQLDRIHVRLAGTRERVEAETKVRGVGRRGATVMNGETLEFSVDYLVHAPPGFRLNLSNRFGNVRLPDLAAAAEVDVRYGDLETGRLAAGSRVAIAFGDADLGFGESLDVEVEYGKLAMAGADEATVRARFSEMRLGRFGRLALDCEYGDYEVQSAGDFVNEGGFNDFRVDSAGALRVSGDYNDVRVGYLATAATLRIGFGDVHVASTSAALERVDFEGSYTDVTVVVAEGLGYTLDAAASYGDIRYPGDVAVTRESSRGTTERVEGRRPGTREAVLTLQSSFGDVTIR